MKLRFQKDAIVNGINIVMKAVPSKTTMSILECILIDASTNEIKLTGNDMELGIETRLRETYWNTARSRWMPSFSLKSPEGFPVKMHPLPLNQMTSSTQPSAVRTPCSIYRDGTGKNLHTFLYRKR